MKDKSELAQNRENAWKETSDDYYKHNTADALGRRGWFAKIISIHNPKSVLEIGCNEGANLRHIRQINPNIKLSGIDINLNAVNYARLTMPKAHIIEGSTYDLSQYFKEKEFDIVFSMGVLIHVPPEMLGTIRDQAVKLAKDAVIHCEEHSINPEPKRWDNGIPHRWSHNYLDLYKRYKVKIYKNVYGSSGGAHQLITIDLGGISKLPILKKIHLWYLCSLVPLVYKWSERIKIRFRVRGWLYFFLPRTKYTEQKFKKE